MDPQSCVHPGGKVICVNNLSRDWNPMDFILIDMLYPPVLSVGSFGTYLAKVSQQLELDGYPAHGHLVAMIHSII